MDDIYIISPDKEVLIKLLKEIEEIVASLNMFINPKKTKISSLQKFRYLKREYCLTSTGKILVRNTNESFRRMRKKILKLKRKNLPFEDILEGYKSWRGSLIKLGNYYRLRKTDRFFKKIFKKEIKEYAREQQNKRYSNGRILRFKKQAI